MSTTPVRSEADVLWQDDFRAGVAGWRVVELGDFAADDATTTSSPAGLRIAARGVHPETGLPAFTRTVGRDDGLPTVLDHVKWLAYAGSFDVPGGGELTCEVELSARTHGTEGHPFGDEVGDHAADPRLATASVNTFDHETGMVFDFFLTSTRVYALYERLCDARSRLGHYAAFSYAVPVLDRSPEDVHRLAVHYDRGAGVVRWLIEGAEVFRVDRIGHRLTGHRPLADHGGTEMGCAPGQLALGLGLFTLLDAGERGLVRLNPDPGHYAAPKSFVDETSKRSSRLFGQGAELTASRCVVTGTGGAACARTT